MNIDYAKLEHAEPIIIIYDQNTLKNTLKKDKKKGKNIHHANRLDDIYRRPAEIMVHRQPVEIIPPRVLTFDEKIQKMWELIASVQWKNKSDEEITIDRQEVLYNQICYNNLFAEIYMSVFYRDIKKELNDLRFFAQCNIASEVEKEKIINHIILLGKTWYDTIISLKDTTFIEYVVANNEYQFDC
jgi:hypothetical protein